MAQNLHSGVMEAKKGPGIEDRRRCLCHIVAREKMTSAKQTTEIDKKEIMVVRKGGSREGYSDFSFHEIRTEEDFEMLMGDGQTLI